MTGGLYTSQCCAVPGGAADVDVLTARGANAGRAGRDDGRPVPGGGADMMNNSSLVRYVKTWVSAGSQRAQLTVLRSNAPAAVTLSLVEICGS